ARPNLERALRSIKPVWNGSRRRYFNKYLVEAVAWLELANTGLRSDVPGAVLANPLQARAAAARLVNQQIGSPGFGFRPRGTGSERTLILSDLPYNPAAYQGLSLGMLGRAITLLGRNASAHAHMVLREVANASWELTGPDGDLAYYGRSQEQAWALSLTAYGADIAARGASAEQGHRYRALASRAMDHLKEAYPVGPQGLWITPALAQDLDAGRHGLDRYADSVAYTGLSLVATDWAASSQVITSVGSIAADSRSANVVGQDVSRIALVRTPSLWFAVKQARSDKIDLRYDFGLVAMKALAADRNWSDVVPARPMVEGHPDSAGPVLFSSRGPAYATGRRIVAGRSGHVRITGAFATASGRRVRGASFRFDPSGDCVTLSFGMRRGEHVEYSAFVRRLAGASAAGVGDGRQRVAISPAAAAYRVDKHRYSSGSDAVLRRVRFEFHGAGGVHISTCSAR
ncbi:MAG: hypothetical protein ACJ76Z_01790, partial [Thermoleophilaceae bacterium]